MEANRVCVRSKNELHGAIHDGKFGRENFGKREQILAAATINRRFRSAPPQGTGRMDKFIAEKLNELGVALFDFTSPSDVEKWLVEQLQH